MPWALDIDAILAAAPPPNPAWMKFARVYHEIKGPLPANYEITKLELRDLIKAWGRSKNQAKIELTQAFRAILAGEPFAAEGERDIMLFKVCAQLTEKHPNASPESVAKLLAPSLDRMGADGPGFDEVLEKMRRRKHEEMSRTDRDNNTRIAEYFHGKRTTAYTEHELQAFANQLECPLHRRWIVQKDRTFYVWGGILDGDGTCHEGQYRGPYTLTEVGNVVRIILAPAASSGLLLDVVTEKSARAKTLNELIRDYGTVADTVRCDLTAQCTYWDEPRRELVEAPCPLRDIEPKEHRAIDWWLRRLAGDDYERLLEWIAGVTMLDIPATALYLEGAPGAGKTLLAQGLARLWSTNGPADFASALGENFNEGLLKCPLVFGDEVAPKNFRGQVKTGEIREFVQARQRGLKRKHIAEATVTGCVRVILACNNKEMLSTTEHLTDNDIAALVERFFYIHVPEEAAEYLRELGEKTVEAWVQQDMIAEHALYLRDTIAVGRSTRLIASSKAPNALTRTLTTSSGIRGAICNWLVAFLLEPSKLEASSARHLLRIHEGQIAVNGRLLSDNWGMYPTNIPPPTATRIAGGVTGLSNGRVNLSTRGAPSQMYRLIDTDNLVQWAEDTGFADREQIHGCIRTHMLRAMQTSNVAVPPPPFPKMS